MDMGLDIDDLTTKASKEMYTKWCGTSERATRSVDATGMRWVQRCVSRQAETADFSISDRLLWRVRGLPCNRFRCSGQTGVLPLAKARIHAVQTNTYAIISTLLAVYLLPAHA